jgi:hypothetical protein
MALSKRAFRLLIILFSANSAKIHHSHLRSGTYLMLMVILFLLLDLAIFLICLLSLAPECGDWRPMLVIIQFGSLACMNWGLLVTMVSGSFPSRLYFSPMKVMRLLATPIP